MIAVALAFFRGLSLRTWLTVAGVIAAVVLVLVLRAHWIDVGADRVQARWDAQETIHARQRAEAIVAARVLEQRHRDEMKAAAERFLAEQGKADEEHAAVIAGLRAGTVRVRDRFRCPSAGVPAASADPAGAFGAGPRGFGIADAEVVLRIGADADRVARQLNALIQACTVR